VNLLLPNQSFGVAVLLRNPFYPPNFHGSILQDSTSVGLCQPI
jgi:hypothetical protein